MAVKPTLCSRNRSLVALYHFSAAGLVRTAESFSCCSLTIAPAIATWRRCKMGLLNNSLTKSPHLLLAWIAWQPLHRGRLRGFTEHSTQSRNDFLLLLKQKFKCPVLLFQLLPLPFQSVFRLTNSVQSLFEGLAISQPTLAVYGQLLLRSTLLSLMLLNSAVSYFSLSV